MIAATNTRPARTASRPWAAQVENRLDRILRIMNRGTADVPPVGRACQKNQERSRARSRRPGSRVNHSSSLPSGEHARVRQHDCAHHRREVFDGPEAQQRIFHRAAEVFQDWPHVRAEVNEGSGPGASADQRAPSPRTFPAVGDGVVAYLAAQRGERRPDGGDERQPPRPRVNSQDVCIQLRRP